MEPLERIAKGLPYEPKPAKFGVDYAPGTQDKVAMMALRAEAGEELFHDDDRKDYDGLEGVEVKTSIGSKRDVYQKPSVGIYKTGTGSHRLVWKQ